MSIYTQLYACLYIWLYTCLYTYLYTCLSTLLCTLLSWHAKAIYHWAFAGLGSKMHSLIVCRWYQRRVLMHKTFPRSRLARFVAPSEARYTLGRRHALITIVLEDGAQEYPSILRAIETAGAKTTRAIALDCSSTRLPLWLTRPPWLPSLLPGPT